MPGLFSSQRSHEESQRKNQAEERVWMEALEGRVLLDGVADAIPLDLSMVNHLTGNGPVIYRMDVAAGQKYLILDNYDEGQVHLLDAHQNEIEVMEDND